MQVLFMQDSAWRFKLDRVRQREQNISEHAHYPALAHPLELIASIELTLVGVGLKFKRQSRF